MLRTNGQATRNEAAEVLGPMPASNVFAQTSARRQTTVSVIIKALNEERHIASAIESALAALGKIDGEVILADGGSTDRTIEIASRYPVMVVQLKRMGDRSCGSGAQLGFQYSHGEFLMLIDGDMKLDACFLPLAIEALRRSPTLAGVGGSLIESDIVNEEYEQRRRRPDPDRHIGLVTRLNSSGLYRRAAIKSIGYLTDRNLHRGEELGLGARLRASGWTLAKIEHSLVEHHSHTGSAYRLLLRRIFNKNAWAPGELFRAAITQRHFWLVVRKERQYFTFSLLTGDPAYLVLASRLSGWLTDTCLSAVLPALPSAEFVRWRSVRLGAVRSRRGTSSLSAFGQAFCGSIRPPPPPVKLKVRPAGATDPPSSSPA